MFHCLGFKTQKFKNVNFNDSFFNSFKEDYPEFSQWVLKKNNKEASVFYSNNNIKGFIYIEEREHKIKLCTLKLEKECSLHFYSIMNTLINLGNLKNKNVYLTVFPRHENLISKIIEVGFISTGYKHNELVYEYFI